MHVFTIELDSTNVEFVEFLFTIITDDQKESDVILPILCRVCYWFCI